MEGKAQPPRTSVASRKSNMSRASRKLSAERKRERLRRQHERLEAMKQSESLDSFHKMLLEIMNKPRVYDDWKDHSEDPSYSKFEVPYFMQCRDRYVEAREIYEQQFQREITLLLENNTSAYEVARATRHLGITTLWPPLHNRREITHTQRYFFRLKPKQRSRLNYIMTHDFN